MQVGQKEVAYTCRFASLKECIHSDTCIFVLQFALVFDTVFWVHICALVTMIYLFQLIG